MKILVYFLSITILLLSCITCEDVMAVEINRQTNEAILTISNTNTLPDNDHCSPLCTCNCCGQPIVNICTELLTLQPKSLSSNQIKPGYQSRNVSDYIRNIWQPPKLNKNLIG
ncbi:DUF6660 family protein [Pedobacter sp. GR22-10]|uniref:DUF6660 family protein n=1 Tax=Pedobacter sp. GR22-10 TaxID=2994472 RepID=UPI003A4D587A